MLRLGIAAPGFKDIGKLFAGFGEILEESWGSWGGLDRLWEGSRWILGGS